MKRIALIGANGQLGIDLEKVLQANFDVTGLTLENIDIRKLDSIETCLSKYTPDIVLSTAGFHNVPYCEEDPASAFMVNSVGTKYLTDWCFYNNCKFVFISTDYVFNGKKQVPYTENDLPDPINTYGLSKYAAELYIQHHIEDHIIIRTTGLYGENICLGKPVSNFFEMFVDLIKGKDVVEFNGREMCCPTYTEELAQQLSILLQKNVTGLFHVVNEGPHSWFQFGQAIIDELGLATSLKHIEPVNQFPSVKLHYQVLKRPIYTALENHNLRKLGLNQMSSCRVALHKFLEKKKNT